MAGSVSPQNQLCASCGGVSVAVGVRTDAPERHSIWLWRPSRRGWGSRDVTTVRALACVDCGVVTFRATDLDRLRAEVAEHPGLFRWDD
jgi:ribosomal protein S27AE